ncbi:hypothetical protein [Draconibacterium orientale]|uniref:hypothetical protein n=1 Tax=Draconibacterium orientale TaxID=1168034 RepID=UPI0029C08FDB|nr:hypothetical protein [Draconibacterium orientale]
MLTKKQRLPDVKTNWQPKQQNSIHLSFNTYTRPKGLQNMFKAHNIYRGLILKYFDRKL